MPAQIQFIPGPPVSTVSRTAAERGLRNHEAIRKGASYALEQMDGHWVAAIVHADAPPFGGGDETEESAAPKAEGGAGLSDSSGPDDSDSGSDDDGPPKKKKGESGELSQVLQMLQQIGEALGIPLDAGMGDPGADPGAGAPPGPPGLGGPPPPGPPGPGGDNTQHVIHEKTMKPGEVPPGGTPVGAPAFASVRRDHPWAHVANQVASFQVGPTPIGDTPIHKVAEELDRLSSEIGYRYKLREDRDEDGQRVAVAIITKH